MTSDLSRKDNPQNITKIIGRPSPTAIARDAKRIGKFLLSPKGLLYTGKQFVLQIMNPNTENVKGMKAYINYVMQMKKAKQIIDYCD